MLSKVWEIIQTYSDLMGFELPLLDGLHSSVPMKKNTHLGFDIVNNKIENVKYYFTSDIDIPEKYLQLSVPRQEYSIALADHTASLRWNCRPDFEPAPYTNHRNILNLLLNQIQLQEQEAHCLKIADDIQMSTQTKRYPLVGYGASHDVQDHKKITDIKLYYTFWTIENWDDSYGRNYSDFSKRALQSISSQMKNDLFTQNYLPISDIMLKYDNLISGFACNIGKQETAYKIYYITEDQTWLESVNAMHTFLFGKSLDLRFEKLFEAIRSLGYRYEEIVYAVSGDCQGVKVYFMV